MSEPNPLVSIWCPTFNHENHIRQCLDGFISQKTSFRIEIIVHDDASTDSTPKIIREYESKYPELFRCFYQTENQLSQNRDFLSKKLIHEAKGKYIALCEGDDFWTDSLKLQKQVNFLENELDFSACGHLAYVLKNGEITHDIIGNFPNQVFTIEDFSQGYKRIPTGSLVFKRDSNLIHPILSQVYGVDRALLFLLAKNGKIKILDFCGSIYRVHATSSEASYRSDGKKLAYRNIYENGIFLKYVDRKYKSKLAKKIRWNYFYLLLLSFKQIRILDALILIPQLFRYQLVVMGFHWAIPKS